LPPQPIHHQKPTQGTCRLGLQVRRQPHRFQFLGEAGQALGESRQLAGRLELVHPAQAGQDLLADAAAHPLVLNELKVGSAARLTVKFEPGEVHDQNEAGDQRHQ
jgi:hypothetical protein